MMKNGVSRHQLKKTEETLFYHTQKFLMPSPTPNRVDGQQQQQQQQRQEELLSNREEEYLSAHRAAVEAVMIGRETLEVAVGQGEQLQNAETLADETEYKLDRAARVLRGMTWSGWWANKFSSDVPPPEFTSINAINGMAEMPPKVYENVPDFCAAAAQAVQNYHVNVQVLETCETGEQIETCLLICDNMFHQAKREITALHRQQQLLSDDKNVEVWRGFPSRLGKDLTVLRERQGQPVQGPSVLNGEQQTSAQAALFAGKSEAVVPSSPSDPVQLQQENHLDSMAKHLDELGSLATNLNLSLTHQSETLDALDGKSDSMLYKSKMVTRRSDQVIQKKSWTKAKKEFLYAATIRHAATGKYVAVNISSTSLVLSDKLNETCVFGIWQKQTAAKVFGLQSKYSKRWVGQNLLGQLVCSAYSFDRREEWDAGEVNWSRTSLVCASADWGNGGFLLVRKENHTLMIGGGGIRDKNGADVWCIQELGQPESSGGSGNSGSRDY